MTFSSGSSSVPYFMALLLLLIKLYAAVICCASIIRRAFVLLALRANLTARLRKTAKSRAFHCLTYSSLKNDETNRVSHDLPNSWDFVLNSCKSTLQIPTSVVGPVISIKEPRNLLCNCGGNLSTRLVVPMMYRFVLFLCSSRNVQKSSAVSPVSYLLLLYF